MNNSFKELKKENPQLAEQLREELYYNARKNFPGELPFSERFDLRLTEGSFNKGIVRRKRPEMQKIVDWQGNLIKEKPVTTITYERDSRLDQAIKESFPESFKPYSHVYSQLYDNIQIGTKNEELDLEYNFQFYPIDSTVKAILINYDTTKTWKAFTSFYQNKTRILRVRIQYAERIVNSAGPRFDCYGYIYIPRSQQ